MSNYLPAIEAEIARLEVELFRLRQAAAHIRGVNGELELQAHQKREAMRNQRSGAPQRGAKLARSLKETV